MNQPAAAPELQPEDAARAAFYGLIARLFYAAPDQQLLGQMLHMGAFEETGGDADAQSKKLAQAWRAILEACRSAFPVVLENEHTELFVGVGKAEVTPYLTHYVIKYATDNPLVELRQQLAHWGVARRESANEPEDHKPCDSLLQCNIDRSKSRRSSSSVFCTRVESRFAMR